MTAGEAHIDGYQLGLQVAQQVVDALDLIAREQGRKPDTDDIVAEVESAVARMAAVLNVVRLKEGDGIARAFGEGINSSAGSIRAMMEALRGGTPH